MLQGVLKFISGENRVGKGAKKIVEISGQQIAEEERESFSGQDCVMSRELLSSRTKESLYNKYMGILSSRELLEHSVKHSRASRMEGRTHKWKDIGLRKTKFSLDYGAVVNVLTPMIITQFMSG